MPEHPARLSRQNSRPVTSGRFEAEENARQADVADKVTFRRENLFDTDISQASVLTLYLSLKINIALRPRILQMMKPGT